MTQVCIQNTALSTPKTSPPRLTSCVKMLQTMRQETVLTEPGTTRCTTTGSWCRSTPASSPAGSATRNRRVPTGLAYSTWNTARGRGDAGCLPGAQRRCPGAGLHPRGLLARAGQARPFLRRAGVHARRDLRRDPELRALSGGDGAAHHAAGGPRGGLDLAPHRRFGGDRRRITVAGHSAGAVGSHDAGLPVAAVRCGAAQGHGAQRAGDLGPARPGTDHGRPSCNPRCSSRRSRWRRRARRLPAPKQGTLYTVTGGDESQEYHRQTA